MKSPLNFNTHTDMNEGGERCKRETSRGSFVHSLVRQTNITTVQLRLMMASVLQVFGHEHVGLMMALEEKSEDQYSYYSSS